MLFAACAAHAACGEGPLLHAAPAERARRVARWITRDGLDAAARSAARIALAGCPSEAVDPSGTTSHALSGVGFARRLAARMPPERAPLALIQAAGFAADEVARSPYFTGRWELPAPAPGVSAAELRAALDAHDVARADAAALAAGGSAWPELYRRAFGALGHVGHGPIAVGVAASLGDPGLVRSPARYLASIALADATAAEVEAARGGGLFGRAAQLAERARGGESAEGSGQALVRDAAELVHAARRVDAATCHVVAWCDAAAASGALESLLAAAGWLDRVEGGGTELGPWSSPPPLAPRPGGLAELAAAVRARDPDGAAAIAAGMPSTPALWAYLAEAAVVNAAVTVQHTVELVAITPDTPAGRAAAARFLAWAHGGEGDDYHDALAATGLRRHPLV